MNVLRKIALLGILALTSAAVDAACIPLYTLQQKIECLNSCMLRFVNCKVENFSNPEACQAGYNQCSSRCNACITIRIRLPLGDASTIESSPTEAGICKAVPAAELDDGLSPRSSLQAPSDAVM